MNLVPVPDGALLVPGAYFLELEASDALLEWLRANPAAAAAVVRFVIDQTGADFVYLGSGVAHKGDGRRVFSIRLEVPETTAAPVQLAGIGSVVRLALLALGVAAGVAVTVRLYRLEDGELGDVVGDVADTARSAVALGRLALVGVAAFMAHRLWGVWRS